MVISPQHEEGVQKHAALFTAFKAVSFLQQCQNPCAFTNFNAFWIWEISLFLHKWLCGLTWLLEMVTLRSRHSLANTEDFLHEICGNNLTVIDNVIELCQCHKARCQQSVLQSISTTSRAAWTICKRKNYTKLWLLKSKSKKSSHVWVLSHCKDGRGQKEKKCINPPYLCVYVYDFCHGAS